LEEKKKKMKRDEVNATGYHDAEDIQDILFRMQYKYLLHMSHKTWRWCYGLSKISGHNLFHILGQGRPKQFGGPDLILEIYSS
jgi:hypothetical protein